jgi:uncharacterized protein YigE (DUF2233 family)
MKQPRTLYILALLICCTGLYAQQVDSRFVTFTCKAHEVELYWKDDAGRVIGSLQNVKSLVEKKGKHLRFAMNGGMYNKDRSPQGLFIQNDSVLAPLDTLSGGGNFYLKPNGVFYITKKGLPHICPTEKFNNKGDILYATQSGPMLLIDGAIHPAFKKGSVNLNIRNGVGILPDNRLVFAMSKSEINFYDFAEYFKSMGCENALYLDGFVSRTYLPEAEWIQLDGSFGVIIGVSH